MNKLLHHKVCFAEINSLFTCVSLKLVSLLDNKSYRIPTLQFGKLVSSKNDNIIQALEKRKVLNKLCLTDPFLAGCTWKPGAWFSYLPLNWIVSLFLSLLSSYNFHTMIWNFVCGTKSQKMYILLNQSCYCEVVVVGEML
jgi:hypothetical protein